MRLKSLELYGVGQHRGEVLRNLGDGLTVVYGDNEAGKSTLLAGLRGVLFGKVVSWEPGLVMGKGAEGRVVVESSSGNTYVIERALGRKNPAKITAPNGEVFVGHDVLKERLPELSVVEDYIYQSVFTFQLAEMNDFANADESLQSRIYSVGMLGKTSPLEVEMRLLAQAKEIFNPNRRAKNPKFLQCLQEIDKWREALVAKRDSPADYERACLQLAACQTRLQEIEAQWENLQKHRALVQKDALALPIHQEIVRIRERIRDEGLIVQITEEQKSDAMELRSRFVASETHSYELETTCRDIEAKLSELMVDEAHLQLLPNLRELQTAASGMMVYGQQISELSREMETLEAQIATSVAQLSREWTDDGIERVNVSLALMEQVHAIDNTFQWSKRELDNLERSRATQTRALEQWQRQLEQHGITEAETRDQLRMQQLETQQQGTDLSEDEDRLTELTRCVDAKRALEIERDGQVEALQRMNPLRASGQMTGMKFWLWSLSAVCAVLSVVTWFAHELLTSIPLGAVALGLMGLGFYATTHHGKSPEFTLEQAEYERRIQTLNSQIANCVERVHVLHRAIQTIEVNWEAANATEVARSALRQAKTAYVRKKDWLETGIQLRTQWHLALQELHRVETEHQTASQDWSRVQQAWLELLTAIGLHGAHMLPAVFIKEFEVVQQVRANQQLLKQKTQTKRTLGGMIRAYVTSVHDTLTALQFAGMNSDEVAVAEEEEAPVSLVTWVTQLEMALAKAEEVEERDRDRQECIRQLEGVQQALLKEHSLQGELNSRKLDLYRSLAVHDDESYEKLLAQHVEQETQERKLQACCNEVYGLYGGRETYELRIQGLNETSHELLDEALEQLKVAYAQYKDRSNATLKEIGELERRVAQWQDGDSTLELQWNLSIAVSERSELARQWAGYTVASHLLREAREKFEQHRRPQSLMTAGAIFQNISAGKYIGFKVRADEKGTTRLICLDKQAREWEVANLSRGTREQVYLAIRLAVIQEYKERGVKLPVVMDDVMVNFDSHRLSACFDVLHEYAEDNQVIYLTCQRQVVDYVAGKKDTTCITLG